ncbi:MAG: Fe(2+) transporter permease subunit FeoB [Deltaproteobacteria bacterium]|nr:Fe(2+) transporter permease subunit FeoB [Deltaproteobacteria bacterium]
MSSITIGLAGNPNCGKTTLFNDLTGAKQSVGNWPGVTVERKTGSYNHLNKDLEVVDLPGIYSLSATSLDEQIARDYVISGKPDLIVNIVDASNIERNLYLTVQLLEMKIPVVIALNMMDIVKQRGIKINVKQLENFLGCPVVPTVANKNEGINHLKDAINTAAVDKKISPAAVEYPAEIEKAIANLILLVKKEASQRSIDSRWLAVKLLEGDEMAIDMAGDMAKPLLTEARKEIKANLGDDSDIMVADSRYGFINGIYKNAVQKRFEIRKTFSDAVDKIMLNRLLGIPIFLFAMYLTFMITINIGGCFIDFFDIFFGTIFVDGFGNLLLSLHVPVLIKTILADGIGGGIQTISTFIPPIGFMFLCLSILEDSGYMARAAFVMDRFMRFVGLPGKSFIPMLVGFGCNIPAIMATRTLENERDRTMTIMMNPFMSCGARLPVYALFAAAFFPRSGSTLVFLLYIIGIAMAVMTGLILKSTVLKGKASHFIMELPPYHLPTVKGILIHTYDRLKTFMFRAGKVIISIVIILSFLNAIGTDGTFGHEDSEDSVLSSIGRTITPVFRPMGISQDNWPATVGIFTGIFAKEAVVGTLDSLYSAMEVKGQKGDAEEEEFSFWGGIRDSFASIPAAFSDLGATVTDPLGVSIGDDLSNLKEVAEAQEVNTSTFGAMIKTFDGKIGAFAYLLFILMYFPCVAAIATVYRETNMKWTVFVGAYTTLLAWVSATLFYQLATIGRHPVESLMWLTVIGLAFIAFLYGMRRAGRRIPTRSTVKELAQPI